jgi:hypothetical protein
MTDAAHNHHLLQARTCQPLGNTPSRFVVIAHGTFPNNRDAVPGRCEAETTRWFLDRGFVVVMGPRVLSAAPICSQQRASRRWLIGPPEDRSYCRTAIISDHPPLDLSRRERGQPHHNFASLKSYETESTAASISACSV